MKKAIVILLALTLTLSLTWLTRSSREFSELSPSSLTLS